MDFFCRSIFQPSNGQMEWKSGNLNHLQLKCMKYLISVKDIIFSLRAGRKPIRYHDKLNIVELLLSLPIVHFSFCIHLFAFDSK